MFCSICGVQSAANISFCRQCGNDLDQTSLVKLKPGQGIRDRWITARSKDPDELTGNGIGSVIVGDGFFMVAVLLSATDSSVSSLLWLFLLIPAFFFFGKGFADVLHARQIRRRMKQDELAGAPNAAALLPPQVSLVDAIKKHTSGELVSVPSVTERTTRELTGID